MKIFQQFNNVRAKTTLAVALCTVLAMTIVRADDDDIGSAKGGAGKSSSSQAGSSASSLDQQDQKFVKQAAKGGMKEIQMAKVGLQKASNEGVKQYAQRLLDDHTKASSELKQIASSKGITLPDAHATSSGEQPGRTPVREKEGVEAGEHSGHEAHMKKLETLSGAEFDREFVRMAVQDHQKDIKEFEKAAQSAQDPEIKAFAQKTAPKLREHLQQAKALQSQVGGSDSSSTGAPGSASGSTSAASGSRQTSGSTDASEGQNSSGQGGTDAINKARGNTGGDTPAGAPTSK
jgi:putative membrane protein